MNWFTQARWGWPPSVNDFFWCFPLKTCILYITIHLYLCISFSVFEDLGLWPLWAIKVVTRQVWTFRWDIRGQYGKSFSSLSFLNLNPGLFFWIWLVFKFPNQEGECESWESWPCTPTCGQSWTKLLSFQYKGTKDMSLTIAPQLEI